MKDEGTKVGVDSAVSFSKDFKEPMERMVQLHEWSNRNAASRGYGEGNFAMGEGEAAMYLQGPWALTEIEKTAPDAPLGNFPLPMTDNPDERRVRVNLDLALWIPEASPKQEAAREFLDFLTQPQVQDRFNQEIPGLRNQGGCAAPAGRAHRGAAVVLRRRAASTRGRRRRSRSRSRRRATSRA